MGSRVAVKKDITWLSSHSGLLVFQTGDEDSPMHWSRQYIAMFNLSKDSRRVDLVVHHLTPEMDATKHPRLPLGMYEVNLNP